MYTDCHCHVYNEYFNINEITKKIMNSNVKRVINNGVDFKTSCEVIELSKKYEFMYCAIGLHPQENLNDYDNVVKLIEENINNQKFIAIGEIGLDYTHSDNNKEEQISIFERQLCLAEKYNIPVIVHSRDATQDTINILKKYKVKGIIHCFNGSVEIAKEYIKMGFYLGINGVITFKNCKLINVIKKIGIDNIVFETDSPYLTPHPYRGEVNDPTYIDEIINFISINTGIEFKTLCDVSENNVMQLFDKI